MWVQSLGQEDPLENSLEKEMATHSSILAWEVPWMEESGGLPWSLRVEHYWATECTLTHTHTHTHAYGPLSRAVLSRSGHPIGGSEMSSALPWLTYERAHICMYRHLDMHKRSHVHAHAHTHTHTFTYSECISLSRYCPWGTVEKKSQNLSLFLIGLKNNIYCFLWEFGDITEGRFWALWLHFTNIIIFIFVCPGSSALHGLFFSCCEQRLLPSYDVWASHGGGFSCGSWAPEHRLNICGTWA